VKPDGITVRGVRRSDGASLWRLARDAGTLDVNTPYAYLLFAAEFGGTCVVAERDGEPVGFATAFLRPARPDTVFLWQIGVAASVRGRGVGVRLLEALLALPGCAGVTALETTVTPDNAASRALFASFARRAGATAEVAPSHFGPSDFPDEAAHEPEDLFRIAPLRGAPHTENESAFALEGSR